MNHSLCLILSGGPFVRPAHIPEAGLTIACDRGITYAERLGVTPDLIIGDFDSYRGPLPQDVPAVTLPVRKDDTDTGYALRYAVEHGYREIVIVAALGGRLDHTLANLQSATEAVIKGARVTLLGEDATVYLLTAGEIKLWPTKEQALSVFALTDACRDVCCAGADYTLEHATLTNRYPVGVSNHAECEVTVSVGEGVLAVMLCALG